MEKLVIFLVNLAVGLVLAGVAVPLIRGKVKPNRVYGFRTPKTLSSEAIWYPANRVAGWALFWAGVVVVAGSTLVHFTVADLDLAAHVQLGLVVVSVGAAAAWSFLFLRRLSEPKRDA